MSVYSLPWYHSPVIGRVGDTLLMTGEEWRHAYQVLRLKAGEAVIVFDGRGQCMEATLQSGIKHEGVLELRQDRRQDFLKHRPYRLSIAFAPTKNIDRTEFAVEKLVELGVDEITFLSCKHSERDKIRLDRIEKIVLSACKQSRKIILPVVRDLQTPEAMIKYVLDEKPDWRILCCHLDQLSGTVGGNYSPGQDVVVMIGPEGGFSDDEIRQMKTSGASIVTLGPYRLRVETAAIAACVCIHIINDLTTL